MEPKLYSKHAAPREARRHRYHMAQGSLEKFAYGAIPPKSDSLEQFPYEAIT